MKSFYTKNIKISLTLILFTLGVISVAHEDDEESILNDPKILTAFNSYQLTDVGNEADVNAIYDELRTDLLNNPKNNCYERAHVWSYQMQQSRQIQSGKIFLFYAYGPGGSWNFNEMGWWFHVAPYVISGNQEFVMEKMFDLNTPLRMQDWLKKQTGGKVCKELNGTEFDLLDSIPRKYSMPSTQAPCYYRKAPMTYHLPINVYNHDVKKQSVLGTQITSSSAYSSCYNAIIAYSKKDRRDKCSKVSQDPSRLF